MSVRMAFIGEAWGAEEARAKQPFVGRSGLLLNMVLRQLGIDRHACLITNCFNLQPPDNKLPKILTTKKEAAPGWPKLGSKYLPIPLVAEIERMRNEIRRYQPEVIVALGSTALWGLTGSSTLATHRGHVHDWEGYPMVPTYHPARCLRQYSLKTSMVADILKAKRIAKHELTIDELHYNAEPNLAQIAGFFARVRQAGIVAVDIETIPSLRVITMIGFGLHDFSVCVPFYHEDRPDKNYWTDWEEETAAFRLVAALLADSTVAKIFHHAAYDIAWIADIWHMPINGMVYDTRILHADLLAELPHSLTDVAANYLCMPPWKNEFRSAKETDSATEKAGDE